MKTILITAALILSALFAIAPTASASNGCVGQPGSVQACVGPSGAYECVAVGLGLQGGYACANPSNGDVRVCTSLYINDIGNCPTDLLSIVSVQYPNQCVGQSGAVDACVAVLGPYGTCAAVGVGLQGASVCSASDGIRVCTTGSFGCTYVPTN